MKKLTLDERLLLIAASASAFLNAVEDGAAPRLTANLAINLRAVLQDEAQRRGLGVMP